MTLRYLSYPAIAGTLAVILSGAALTTALVIHGNDDQQMGKLKQAEIAQAYTDSHALTSAGNAIASLSAEESQRYTKIENVLGQLSTPNDPLSSYNQICSQYQINQSGVNQIFYYPCTNSVQTIPQPGN